MAYGAISGILVPENDILMSNSSRPPHYCAWSFVKVFFVKVFCVTVLVALQAGAVAMLCRGTRRRMVSDSFGWVLPG
jgi:hypothetical protein